MPGDQNRRESAAPHKKKARRHTAVEPPFLVTLAQVGSSKLNLLCTAALNRSCVYVRNGSNRKRAGWDVKS
jgi:hypothetical protein